MKRRLVVFVLLIACIVSMVSCTDKSAKKTGGGDFDSAPVIRFAISNQYEKALGNSGDDLYDNPYIRHIYEKTGVRVEPILLSANDSEKNQQLAVMRAGGEQIDLILNWDIQQAYMQSGLIIKINELLKKYKDLIPNLLDDKNIPEIAWNGVSKRSEIWGIPGRSMLPNPAIQYIYFRKDWMDNLGLKMPKNTDELGEICRAFTYDDPDGNGIDDTCAMVHSGENTVNSLLVLLGCNSWNEVYVDGKLENGAMTDRARKAFSLLRSWDKAGYINHDGIADTKAHDNLISTNRAGIVVGNAQVLKRLTEALHDNGFVDAEWVMPKTQIVSSIDNTFYGMNNKDKNHGSATMITSMAKDYESIFKLLNWAYSKEGTFFLSHGIEGREYNTVDGKTVRDAAYCKDKSYLGMFNFGKSYQYYYKDLAYASYGDNEFAKNYVDEVTNNYDNYVGKRSSISIKFDYPELPEFTTYSDWRKGVATNMMKFVAGDLDPDDDATWKNYIKECNSYGMRKLLDAALNAYNDDNERKDKVNLEEYFK